MSILLTEFILHQESLNYFMKIFNAFLIVMFVSIGFSQKPMKDFYLKKSLKQDGFQYQFTVLDEDERGVWYFNKSKFYFWYKAQKVLSTQGGASGQLLNGDFEAFHENKQLAQKGTFRKGLKEGKWMYWRKDGTLITIENWKQGKYAGTKELFNEKGELIETCKYSRFKCVKTVGDSVIVIKKREPRAENRDSKKTKKTDSETTEKKHWLKNLFKKKDPSASSETKSSANKKDSEKPKKEPKIKKRGLKTES
jgi:hypothetical protein